MSTILFTGEQFTRARRISRDIGWAIREARMAAGETQAQAAAALGTYQRSVGDIERGDSPNVKLGSLVKLLDRYGLKLVVERTVGLQARPIATPNMRTAVTAAGGADR